MSNLMEKLALSKAIMDKADGIKNSNSMNGGLPPTSLQQFDHLIYQRQNIIFLQNFYRNQNKHNNLTYQMHQEKIPSQLEFQQ
jgi:hypothetical protein